MEFPPALCLEINDFSRIYLGLISSSSLFYNILSLLAFKLSLFV